MLDIQVEITKYTGMKDTKKKDIIAFYLGMLYGFLKTRISLFRKEKL